MTLILPRRRFLAGLASALAAPAIVRAASLMPVKVLPIDPANPTSLLDYEDGEWTPTITFATGDRLQIAYPAGRYTRIGNMVMVDFRATFEAPSSSGEVRINGLPFVPRAD